MKTITKICTHCQSKFEASLKEHNRGNAKFCSSSCFTSSRKGKVIPKDHNCKCARCEISFYRSASKMKNSKNGLQFCSRACKDKAQSTMEEIQPPHYGNRSTVYRKIAFENKPLICEDCGFNRVPEVLEVHHKDRDRTNNDISNLKILCPTCHVIDHFYNKDGRFK